VTRRLTVFRSADLMARMVAVEVEDLPQDSRDRTGTATCMVAGDPTPLATDAYPRRMPITWVDIRLRPTDPEGDASGAPRDQDSGLREVLLRHRTWPARPQVIEVWTT
jgi:hypothetical protein